MTDSLAKLLLFQYEEGDIELSIFPIPCFIYVCPSVEGNYAENSHIVFSSRYYKAFIFNLSCVLMCFLER